MRGAYFTANRKAGIITVASGARLNRGAALTLKGAYGELFRGGVPMQPWPVFLPPVDEVRSNAESLAKALTYMDWLDIP